VNELAKARIKVPIYALILVNFRDENRGMIACKQEVRMEDLIELGQAFVQAMRDRRGIAHVPEIYAKNAESVEAVVPPGRDVRIAKGREAIEAKRADWLAAHDLHTLNADGPYVHPPNRFAVRFEAEVTQKATGNQMTLREVAIYTVEDGMIIREEFFMLPK
jgi:hypothetical protein